LFRLGPRGEHGGKESGCSLVGKEKGMQNSPADPRKGRQKSTRKKFWGEGKKPFAVSASRRRGNVTQGVGKDGRKLRKGMPCHKAWEPPGNRVWIKGPQFVEGGRKKRGRFLKNVPRKERIACKITTKEHPKKKRRGSRPRIAKGEGIKNDSEAAAETQHRMSWKRSSQNTDAKNSLCPGEPHGQQKRKKLLKKKPFGASNRTKGRGGYLSPASIKQKNKKGKEKCEGGKGRDPNGRSEW